ncbi:MAG: AAA family ATPase [Actinomycetia bacterium]|nr:AAA family ATPase [Actinomycetes bacterium]
MRRPIDSPFCPGSDTVPQVWAGRTDQLTDWREVLRPRRLDGLPERGRTVLGEPGTGKSSLVRRIAAEAQEAGDWVTPQLRIPSGSDPFKRLAAALLDLADTAGLSARHDQRVGALLSRVETVQAAGVGLGLRAADGPDPYTAVTDLLVELGRAALRHNVAVMVHLDEVQNIQDADVRSQLLITLGDALTHEEQVIAPGGYPVQRALPVTVYLTGLPEFTDLASTRTGATFARRFQTTMLDTMTDDDLLVALQTFVTDGWPVASDSGHLTRVGMEPAAQQAIVDLARGEPFLFQLAGEQAWYAGTGDTITADEVRTGWQRVAPQAEMHVQKLLDRLPARERDFLDAMAALPPSQRSLGRIAKQLGYEKSTAAGPTAQRLDLLRRLISRGSRYAFRHRAVEALLTSDWPALPD